MADVSTEFGICHVCHKFKVMTFVDGAGYCADHVPLRVDDEAMGLVFLKASEFMNRRNALKVMGLSVVAAAAAPLMSIENNVSRNDEFVAWLREYAPLSHRPRIVVAGMPKSGRTNLMTMLSMHYFNEMRMSPGADDNVTTDRFWNTQMTEVTFNRNFTYDSATMRAVWNADVVLLSRHGAGEPFNVSVVKNRWGAQDDNLVFCVDRMSPHDVQNFVRSEIPRRLYTSPRLRVI